VADCIWFTIEKQAQAQEMLTIDSTYIYEYISCQLWDMIIIYLNYWSYLRHLDSVWKMCLEISDSD